MIHFITAPRLVCRVLEQIVHRCLSNLGGFKLGGLQLPGLPRILDVEAHLSLNSPGGEAPIETPASLETVLRDFSSTGHNWV